MATITEQMFDDEYGVDTLIDGLHTVSIGPGITFLVDTHMTRQGEPMSVWFNPVSVFGNEQGHYLVQVDTGGDQ